MEIFEKIENQTSVCYGKTGHKERENMVTVNHGKEATFQPVLHNCKKKLPLCKVSGGGGAPPVFFQV